MCCRHEGHHLTPILYFTLIFPYSRNPPDSRFIKELEEKRKIEVKSQNSLSPGIETRLFGPSFERSFSMPLLNPAETKAQIDRNLDSLVASVFDPIESIKQPRTDPVSQRVVPYYNKFYADLSCGRVNVFETPVEALFVTLSKVSWNQKLRRNNRAKINRICSGISGADCPELLSRKKLDHRRDRDQLANLQTLGASYAYILENLA